jgi:SAM-dependent methyltransferase
MPTNRQPEDRVDQEDFDFLALTATAARQQGLSHFQHLDQPIGILNYIRIANEIAAAVPAGRLLDWGCGFGQMTYLLRRRGFDVVPFDVGPDISYPNVPLCRELDVVRTSHPTRLPFDDASFDAVLSCGVLEHVDEFSQPGNEIRSLAEIRRVLKPEGYFPVYQLPQRLAWQEAVIRTIGGGYAHPRRYSAAEIRAILTRSGYRIERLRRNNLFPKNLTGVPTALRDVYSLAAKPILALDALLCRLPALNQLAGVMELIARRDDASRLS